MEKNIENAEEKVESVGVEPEDIEQILEGAGERTVSTEEKTAAETAPSQNEGKKRDDRENISRTRIAGWMELAAAFILTVLSVGLFFNTRGTRLLYVSVATGRVSRYYYFFLLAALIFLMMGVFTLKFCRRKEKENLLERDEEAGKKHCETEKNTV